MAGKYCTITFRAHQLLSRFQEYLLRFDLVNQCYNTRDPEELWLNVEDFK